MVVGGGPFAIANGDTAEVAFAYISGHTLAELRANAAAARASYSQLISVANIATPGTTSWIDVHPNPANDITSVVLHLVRSCDVSLVLTDERGSRVTPIVDSVLSSGVHTLPVDLSRLADGVYFVDGDAGGRILHAKLVKQTH
jgi:hypothetical protein